MNGSPTRRRLWLLVLVVGVAAACTRVDPVPEAAPEASGATSVGETASGSTTTEGATQTDLGGLLSISENTLVWVHDQEPTSMHYDDPVHRLAVTSWIRRTLLEGLYGVSGATEFYPELLADEGEVVENDDGTVTVLLSLRPDLRWSNGEPLTTADVAYTWDIWREGCILEEDGTIGDGAGCVYLGGNRAGLDLITAVQPIDETEFSMTFVEFYAGWKGMFDEIFHPSFGADAAEVNVALATWQTPDGVPLVSAGPMIFDTWVRGVSLSLVRNDLYHGSASPDARNRGVAQVDGVLVQFVADTESQITAIEQGWAHVIMTQPQVAFGERLSGSGNFTVASAAGPIYEHWGFNVLNPHLADSRVREALAYALDKSEVVRELYEPLFGGVLPQEGLGNTYWMTNQRHYEDHQTVYAGPQTAQAARLLEEAGYVRGSDGTFEHPERGRLSLRVGTTGGNEMRELQQVIISEQMAAAGIEIVIDNVEGNDYFTAQPFATEALVAAATKGVEGDPNIWDIAQFAWAGSPWPGGNSASYLGGLPSNPYGFDNPDFDAQSRVCDTMIDNVERAGCYNDLDLYLTTLEKGDDGLIVVPLTQKPSYYGYLSSVLSGAGIASDADDAGPLANVVDFRFK